jgi:hypothetical protein
MDVTTACTGGGQGTAANDDESSLPHQLPRAAATSLVGQPGQSIAGKDVVGGVQ